MWAKTQDLPSIYSGVSTVYWRFLYAIVKKLCLEHACWTKLRENQCLTLRQLLLFLRSRPAISPHFKLMTADYTHFLCVLTTYLHSIFLTDCHRRPPPPPPPPLVSVFFFSPPLLLPKSLATCLAISARLTKGGIATTILASDCLSTVYLPDWILAIISVVLQGKVRW